MSNNILLLVILIFVLGFWIFYSLKKGYNNANIIKEPQVKRQNKAMNLAKDFVNKGYATIMVKNIDPFLSLPIDTLFVFLAKDDKLTIITQTIPKTNFELNYNQITLFQLNETKKIVGDKVGQFRINIEKEQITKRLHLEYMSHGTNRIMIGDFIYDNTFEDRGFNEIASQGEDIFTYVNARIPKQDNTVIL